MSIHVLSNARRAAAATIIRSSGYHQEAMNWASRVLNNGGSVSASTMKAVSDFCKAVDLLGVRDKFYRLNLFCGDSLSAALVPLYLGTSFGGTRLGNATDTNNGPFVSADYVETGSTGGLTKSNSATTKYLDSGLATNAFPQFTTAHMAFSISTGQTITAGFAMGKGAPGNYNNQGLDRYYLYISTTAGVGMCQATSTGELIISQSPAARYIFSRTAANLITGYRNGSSAGTNTSTVTAPTTSAATFMPFTPSNSALFRAHYYSIGDSMTGTQAAGLDSAFSAYLTAMGRT